MAGDDDTSSSSDAGRGAADSDSPPPPRLPPRPPPKAKVSSGKPPRMGKTVRGKGAKGSRSEKSFKGEKSGKVSKATKHSKGGRQRLVVNIPIKRGRGGAGSSTAASSAKGKKKGGGSGGSSKKKKGTKRGADDDDGAASSGDEYKTNLLSTLSDKLRLCEAYRLELPTALRAGTLDSLIAVADAASRDDRTVEATTDRVLRQYRDLVKDDKAVPLIEGEDVSSYMSFFEWDEAKFNSADSLSDIRQAIVDQVARIEDDMKVQLTEYTATRQALTAIERRSQGNLMTRSLATLVEERMSLSLSISPPSMSSCHPTPWTSSWSATRQLRTSSFRAQLAILRPIMSTL